MLNLKDLQENIDSFAVSESRLIDIDDCPSLFNNPNHYLKIFTQNIRSISHNIAGLVALIARSKTDWDIIVLTECWLKSNCNIPELDGYNKYYTTRNNTQNEGVTIYIKKNISVIVDEPQFAEANCLILQLKDMVIIAIYRPPSYRNISLFLDSLNKILSKKSNINNIVITGDINLNIKGNILEPNAIEYLELTAYHGILPAHSFATRNQNCLDHILLKTKLHAYTYVAQTSLTDHETVLLYLKYKSSPSNPYSSTTKIDQVGLTKSLTNIDFEPVFSSNDVNFATNYIISSVHKAINLNSKCINFTKRKRIIKPWITPGLLKCLRNRDKLHMKSKKAPNNENLKLTYLRYRNFCNNLIKKLKIEHEKNELMKAKNNTRSLWNTINNITGRQQNKSPVTDLLVNHSHPKDAVNNANKYFANVGQNLADRILKLTHNKPYTLHNLQTSLNSFVMLSTDETEVESLIMTLKSNAVGWDNISANFLKQFKHILVPPLTHVCNLAITNGTFPTAFKKSVIIPVHKSGSRDRVENYRPISILPSMSKILEKIINTRLKSFLENNSLLANTQFGFRTGHSTADAVNELTDLIFQNLDNNKKCLTIFLDLAKAFDTVSIPILIQKLNNIGIRGTQLKLFQDYLTDRIQCVKIENTISDELPIQYGVPQGSVLAPTLFLVYINDLCQLSLKNGRVISFADDTALVFYADSYEYLFKYAQNGFNLVAKWLSNNLLTLNVDKTKYILFKKKGNLPELVQTVTSHNCPNFSNNVNCNCPKLQLVDTIKYLGVQLDYKLCFNNHVDKLTSRLRKLMYIFKSLRNIADRRIIKTIYQALCQSLLTYCITTWGGTSKTILLKLERAQRAILKTAFSLPYRHPTNELYKICGVKTVRQLYILATVTRKHSELSYDQTIISEKRRKFAICYIKPHSDFARKSYSILGNILYNIANKILNIYPLTKRLCTAKVSKWLEDLNYEQTENILSKMINN